MGFEKFDGAGSGRGRPAATDPIVSLRKSGSVGVNQVTLDEYFDDHDGAVLYYDDDADQIGIEPVADSDADDAAYTVSKTDSGGTIAAQAFLERYDLRPDITTQYHPHWDDDEALLVADLNDPTKTYGTPDDNDDDDTGATDDE